MIEKTKPQAAHTCFIKAFKHKPSYIMRTIPDISYQLNQVGEEFIPATARGIYRSTIERNYYHSHQSYGARNSNLRTDFKSRTCILPDVIKRSFDENM